MIKNLSNQFMRMFTPPPGVLEHEQKVRSFESTQPYTPRERPKPSKKDTSAQPQTQPTSEASPA